MSEKYAISPRDHTSAAGLIPASTACSGAPQPSVRTTIEARPKVALSCLATPKSSTFTRHGARGSERWRKTFSGLRSRCTMPRSWAAPTPWQSSRKKRAKSLGDKGPCARTWASRVSPWSSSMVIQGTPSVTSES
ncbi:MAG: hypothetical protein R3A48_19275 [Polyangiales bacterium]